MTAVPVDEGRPEWMDRGACVGMDADLFFPPAGALHGDIAAAKAVCAGCPVRQVCGDYALRNGIKFGIWGGMSELDRCRIRRQGPRPA